VQDKRDLWLAHARRVRLGEDAEARLRALPAARRVLVLTEDWCGDAARSVPVLAKAFEVADGVEHRYLPLEGHDALMEAYLTHGGRAIPMAIVQDETGRELGAWGPRPSPLQALTSARRRELGPPDPGDIASWYAPIMGWYSRDAGRTVVDEILMLLERGGTAR
jgi:hypothetical protein